MGELILYYYLQVHFLKIYFQDSNSCNTINHTSFSQGYIGSRIHVLDTIYLNVVVWHLFIDNLTIHLHSKPAVHLGISCHQELQTRDRLYTSSFWKRISPLGNVQLPARGRKRKQIKIHLKGNHNRVIFLARYFLIAIKRTIR